MLQPLKLDVDPEGEGVSCTQPERAAARAPGRAEGRFGLKAQVPVFVKIVGTLVAKHAGGREVAVPGPHALSWGALGHQEDLRPG